MLVSYGIGESQLEGEMQDLIEWTNKPNKLAPLKQMLEKVDINV